MGNIYKSELGKQEVLGQYRKTLDKKGLGLIALTFKHFKPRTAKIPIFSGRILSPINHADLNAFWRS